MHCIGKKNADNERKEIKKKWKKKEMATLRIEQQPHWTKQLPTELQDISI